MQTTLRVPAVCVFLAAILLTGLGAVFITKLVTHQLQARLDFVCSSVAMLASRREV